MGGFYMNKQEIIDILQNDTKNDWLFKEADKIRHENVGDEIHLRALIEFSNICKRQCLYCGLRSPNKEVERYRLTKEDILLSAKKAVDLGYKTIVLQSGEDDSYYSDKMCDIIRKIKDFLKYFPRNIDIFKVLCHNYFRKMHRNRSKP